MLSKIANTFAMIVCGAVIGALAGFFVFFIYFVVKQFFLYVLLGYFFFLGLFLLLKLLKKNSMTILGVVSYSLSWTLTLSGFLGLIQFVSEEGNYTDFDVLLMIAAVILCVPLFSFFVPLRMVWSETNLAKSIESSMAGIKALLRRGI